MNNGERRKDGLDGSTPPANDGKDKEELTDAEALDLFLSLLRKPGGDGDDGGGGSPDDDR